MYIFNKSLTPNHEGPLCLFYGFPVTWQCTGICFLPVGYATLTLLNRTVVNRFSFLIILFLKHNCFTVFL